MILRTTPDGGVLRLKELARVELGASDYSTNAYLSGKETVGILINEKPGSNSLAIAQYRQATMARLAGDFPQGLRHDIAYNPTEFVETSIEKVYSTIYEAIALVILVVLLFLQSWRAALIPILAIPVSLIGTFAVMALLGFSLNTLSLFGLILAIGIVVDDAIVVVENVESRLATGMSAPEAAHKTMDEVGGALLAIALVLSAVFVPTAFITGVSGAFYKQFAVTISVATLISCFVSLTLSPALSALLLKPHAAGHTVPRWRLPITRFFNGFNRAFDNLSRGYGGLIRRMARFSGFVLLVYAGLLALTGWQLTRTPSGFIPAQDRGYALVAYQLPSGSSLARTDAVARRAQEIMLAIDGIAATPTFVGFSGATFTNAPNAGVTFVTFKSFAERTENGRSQDKIIAEMRRRLAVIDEAFVIVIPPPAVSGLGNGGGFKMMVQDRGGVGTNALFGAVMQMMVQAQQVPEVRGVFSSFEVSTPQVVADIDRSKAEISACRSAACSTRWRSTSARPTSTISRSQAAPIA